MVKVKICGITRAEDAAMAVAAGADAIGLVFYPPSSRYVSAAQARQLLQGLGAFTVVTGLFVNPTRAEVEAVLAQVPLHLLQFHGDESADFCASFHRPYMKAVRMRPDLDLDQVFSDYAGASAILLDAYKPGVPGGTGETFDWARVPQQSALPIVLAGGLTPANVACAIATTQVYAVDVSGGVEASAARKDPLKVNQFVVNARTAARRPT